MGSQGGREFWITLAGLFFVTFTAVAFTIALVFFLVVLWDSCDIGASSTNGLVLIYIYLPSALFSTPLAGWILWIFLQPRCGTRWGLVLSCLFQFLIVAGLGGYEYAKGLHYGIPAGESWCPNYNYPEWIRNQQRTP